MFDLKNLNEQQQKAVTANSKPLLLLAGAGSGKTRVITYKIAYLIKELEYRPNSILALTFTKKAASEMKQRVNLLLSSDAYNLSGLYVGTFHAFGAYILRRHGTRLGLEANFSIYDAEDQLSLVKNIIKDLNIDINVKPRAIMQTINKAKTKGIKADDFFANSYGDFYDEVVSKVYREYARRLRGLNAVDFSDLLLLVVKLFEEHPDVLEQYQNRFKYILVDEYQDTNIQQYKIVKELASKHRHICVVGDEDQSIYSWRGATTENIRLFRRDFPDHEIIKLEQNYRSTSVILEAANAVISKNPNRIEKVLWTENKEKYPITIVEVENPEEEALFVLRELNKYQDNLDDVSILYRVNALSRHFEDTFVRFKVPYQLVGGVGFYQRLEIKDILAYLKFLNNFRDEVSLLRIINVPARKIGPKAIETLREAARDLRLSFSDFMWYGSLIVADSTFSEMFLSSSFVKEVLDKYVKLFEKYESFFKQFGGLILKSFNESSSVADYINYILDKLNYAGWISKIASSKEEEMSRFENIKELVNIANSGNYASRDGLQRFLEDISLMEEVKDVDTDVGVKGKVKLMTVHAAKGLEFNTVFVVGAESGIFPHSRSLDNVAQLQEERRLFYVAITRAKRHLYIIYSRNRRMGNIEISSTPSEYIDDIPSNLVEYIKL